MSKPEFIGKSILIAVPDFVGFPEGFEIGLKSLGFKVSVLRNYEYIDVGIKNAVIHNYKKIFKRDKTFKNKVRKEIDYANQFKEVKKLDVDRFDFAIFIRPDLFSPELIDFVKQKTSKIVAYQWDGLDVYPEVYKRIELFDRFFVFDVNDLKKNEKVLPLTNFYFEQSTPVETEIDAYFVGYYKSDRMAGLLKIARKLKDLGLKTAINICINKSTQITELKNEPVNILRKQVTLMENINYILRSKIVLDVGNAVHCGLSMRPFEALGYRKKMITTNPLVKKYDFYHPDNIFVVENENIDGIENFLDLPYKDLPEEIVNKYSFYNWIKYVLDIEPHLPISFPSKQ